MRLRVNGKDHFLQEVRTLRLSMNPLPEKIYRVVGLLGGCPRCGVKGLIYVTRYYEASIQFHGGMDMVHTSYNQEVGCELSLGTLVEVGEEE